VSRSGEFCRHNPLCYFSMSVYCCKRIFRYRLSPETFGYLVRYVPYNIIPTDTVCSFYMLHIEHYVMLPFGSSFLYSAARKYTRNCFAKQVFASLYPLVTSKVILYLIVTAREEENIKFVFI
jgi:hypothetical protein